MLKLNELNEKHSTKSKDTQLNKMQYKNDNYKNLLLHYATATF
jgi:hypothetical protein